MRTTLSAMNRKSEVVPLREHLDELWSEREKRLDERFEAQQKALANAAHELERRLVHLNDLRENVVSRSEYDTKHEALAVELDAVRGEVSVLNGERTGVRGLGSLVISIIAILASVGAVVAIIATSH